MGKRKKGTKIDGWLVFDKPEAMTSTDVVRVVKKALSPQKVGHAGTLDPLATGILPIGLGEATKTMAYIVDSTKEYEFTVRWGEETTTIDREGQVTATSDVTPTAEEIRAVLPEFVGEIQQIPPAFSAIKVDGERAYELARRGEDVQLKPRNVTIHALSLDGVSEKYREASFRTTCGKGTYIRSLARDIAARLGTVAYVEKLRRCRVGPFSLKHAISLALPIDLGHIARAVDRLIPVLTALDDIPALAITEQEADLVRMGRSLPPSTDNRGTVVLLSDGELIAIADADETKVQPKRVFNLK